MEGEREGERGREGKRGGKEGRERGKGKREGKECWGREKRGGEGKVGKRKVNEQEGWRKSKVFHVRLVSFTNQH